MRIIVTLLLLCLLSACSSYAQKGEVVARAEQVRVPQLPDADCRLLDLPTLGLYCAPKAMEVTALRDSILYDKVSRHSHAGYPVFMAKATFWLPSSAGDLQRRVCERARADWYSNWWHDYDRSRWERAHQACEGLFPQPERT